MLIFTFLIIRADASKKAHDAARHPIPTGGNVSYWNNDFISIYWKKAVKLALLAHHKQF